MGKAQSKTLGTLLGLSSQEPVSVGDAGIPLSQRRSGSFDSVNTTTSIGTDRHSIFHSNSMDNLIHKRSKSTRVQNKGKTSIPTKKENGKTYNSLMESASIVTTFSGCDRNVEFSRSYPEATSHKIDTKYDKASRGYESRSGHDRGTGSLELQKDGGVSNNFLVGVEPESTDHIHDEHSIHADGEVENCSVPHLHPSIIQKLSQEEWRELISYTCSTLGQSLLASILDQPSLLENLVYVDRESPPSDEPSLRTAKERRSTHPTATAADECTRNIESMLRKLRYPKHTLASDRPTKKIERTSSLPPLHHFKTGVSEPEGNGSFLDEPDNLLCHSRNSRGGYSSHVSDQADFGGAQGETSELQRSPVEEGQRSRRDREKVNGRHHTHCSHSKHHSNHGRKMRLRSRSDSVRDPHSHVDISLDDDCPGVPENRIRRPRHHHHQHFVCKQCIEEFGASGWNRGKLAKKGWCRKHSPDHENLNSSGSGGEHTPVGPAVVMTLDDVRTATLLLERSTELGGDESGNEEFMRREGENHVEVDGQITQRQSNGGGGEGSGPHLKKKNGMRSQSLDEPSLSMCSSRSPDGVVSRPDETLERHEVADWSELHITPSRSGRDSPATDMAVACLDLNSPRMLQPLGASQHRIEGGEGQVRRIYMHNHQHYHHIIHHSQP